MAKTRAEIQKAYRERKKAELGDVWLKAERDRRRSYHIPAKDLSKSDLKKRREAANKCSEKYRKKKKAEKHERLAVKMDFTAPARRKRITRCLSQAKRTINQLESERDNNYRLYKRVQKRYDRLQKKVQNVESGNDSTPTADAPQFTPRKSADQCLINEGLNPKSHPTLRKRLVFYKALTNELKESNQHQTLTTKITFRNMVFGNFLRKYKGLRTVAKELNVGRNQARKTSTEKKKPAEVTKIQRQTEKKKKLRERITDFYSRDDNSRMMPGKKDVKNGQQKRTLNDYVSNLHAKFLAENPEYNPSFAFFARMRPKHIGLLRLSSRNICLCQRHQNFTYKLSALKRHCPDGITLNPEVFIKQVTDVEFESTLAKLRESGVEINFDEWGIEDDGERRKFKLRNCTEKLDTLMPKLLQEMKDFRAHCYKLTEQFRQLRSLKGNLPVGHVIVQMDFAENYNCRQFDEVQSAYFVTNGVTIHPCVIYYRLETNGPLLHKSFVFISEEHSHNANTVFAFLEKLVPLIKEQVNNVTCIHYWTDSPTSQYRNRSVFLVVAKHHNIFGVKATWSYFEAGHGKGPCDGVGGTTKRLADDAIKRQTRIQNARDFFAWASSLESEMKFVFLNNTESANAKVRLETLCKNVRTVRGTMKLHAVSYSDDSSTICVSETSCFCNRCLFEGDMTCVCDSWTKRVVEFVPIDETANEVAPANSALRQDDMQLHSVDQAVSHTSTPPPPIPFDVNVIIVPPPPQSAAITALRPTTIALPSPSLADRPTALPQHSSDATNEPPCKWQNGMRPLPGQLTDDLIGQWCVVQYDSKPYPGVIQEVDNDSQDLKVQTMSKIGNNRFFWPTKLSADDTDIWYISEHFVTFIDEPKKIGSRHLQVAPEMWAQICKTLDIHL